MVAGTHNCAFHLLSNFEARNINLSLSINILVDFLSLLVVPVAVLSTGTRSISFSCERELTSHCMIAAKFKVVLVLR